MDDGGHGRQSLPPAANIGVETSARARSEGTTSTSYGTVGISPARSDWRRPSGGGTSAASPLRSEGTTPSLSSGPADFPRPNPDGSVATSSAPERSTPRRLSNRVLAFFASRQASAMDRLSLVDKRFGYDTNFESKYKVGKLVGQGSYGRTFKAKAKKGNLKGQTVAVKIIPKDKITTAVAIENVHREVKLLKALSGHTNFVKFHDACEDAFNVYIIMQYCEGGELQARISSRRGGYMEEGAKVIVVQILSAVAFCHLQGVVHRDLKPENILFTTRDENAPVKIVDFGLSYYVTPDERLTDLIGTACYVAPEVVSGSYNMEADIWSIGVITHRLLCGKQPYVEHWGLENLGDVQGTYPMFANDPWPDVSPEAKDFVKRLMNTDYRKRITAAQALTHPWLHDEQQQVPLDILIYKLVDSYLHATPFRCTALKALSKALSEDELVYIRLQFQLLKSNNEECVSFENFQMALMKNATGAMEESGIHHILKALEPSLSDRTMDFEEFCAATISPYQLEALEDWKQMVGTAFDYFECNGNRVVSVDELAQELNLGPTDYYSFYNWIRPEDGKLTLHGYTKFLHGPGSRPGLS